MAEVVIIIIILAVILTILSNPIVWVVGGLIIIGLIIYKTSGDQKTEIKPKANENKEVKNDSTDQPIEVKEDIAYRKWIDTYENHELGFDEWAKKHNIKIIPSDFENYQKEIGDLGTEYSQLLEKLEKCWSELYNKKDYQGPLAKIVEDLCTQGILNYMDIAQIEMKYGYLPPQNCPPYRRLAMLYERQGNYEKAIAVCRQTLCQYVNIDDASKCMLRLMKKINVTPNEKDLQLIEEAKEITGIERKIRP